MNDTQLCLLGNRETFQRRVFPTAAESDSSGGSRKLLLLNQAQSLQDLRVPYGNHLEALKGNREGQHSIRVNDQWRICFRWQGQDAWDVEIVDYH